MIKYKVFLEQPTLDFYRQGYCPREDYTCLGLWVGGMFSGASGKRYHGERALGDIAPGVARTTQLVELNQNLNDFSPDLYSELPVDQMEPYQYSEGADALHFVGENIRLDIRGGSYDWSDAKGRWELHVELLGQACTWWIPKQKGMAAPMHYRSQIGKATGQINGDPVEGFSLLDFIYSHPGVIWFQLPLWRTVEKQWSMWMVEYTDGEIDAGLAWKGQGKTGFSAGHLLRNGVSTAHSDARIFTTYNERGVVRKSRIEIGGEVVELEHDSCSLFPIHTHGRVASTLRGKQIAKSWDYTEWVPDNIGELVDQYVLTDTRPSREAQRQARIENERLMYPEHLPVVQVTMP